MIKWSRDGQFKGSLSFILGYLLFLIQYPDQGERGIIDFHIASLSLELLIHRPSNQCSNSISPQVFSPYLYIWGPLGGSEDPEKLL